MAHRPPTDPSGVPITVESVSTRLWHNEQRVDSLKVIVRKASELAQTCEKQLIEVRGIEGRGGLLAKLSEDQTESAIRQGERMGAMEKKIDKLAERIDEVERAQVDIKARWGAAVAIIGVIVDILLRFKGG